MFNDNYASSDLFVVDAWLSPNRKEVYESNIIYSGERNWGLEELCNEFLSEHWDGSIYEMFNGDDSGLWNVKVLVEVRSYKFWTDYGDEYDSDFSIKDIWHKGKCECFADLKSKWIELK